MTQEHALRQSQTGTILTILASIFLPLSFVAVSHPFDSTNVDLSSQYCAN